MPALLHPFKTLELAQADRGLDVWHVVLEAGQDYVVTPRSLGRVALERVAAHPVQAPNPRLVNHLGRACQHPSLAGREVLRGVEGEGDEVYQARIAAGRGPY